MNLYRYTGNKAPNEADPSGLDYIKSSDADVFWVVEENGRLWNPNIRRVKIGFTPDREVVKLDAEFGEGVVDDERREQAS